MLDWSATARSPIHNVCVTFAQWRRDRWAIVVDPNASTHEPEEFFNKLGRYGNLRRAWSRETGLPATNLSSRSRSTPVDFWPAWNDYFTSRPRNGGRDPLFAGDAGRILLDHQHFALT
jgi:hypothetical protein